MESKGFYLKFESLPIEAQKQVLSFIEFLQKKYESKRKKPSERKSLADKKFVGIWKNREDLKDSTSSKRNLRKTEWEKIDGKKLKIK